MNNTRLYTLLLIGLLFLSSSSIIICRNDSTLFFKNYYKVNLCQTSKATDVEFSVGLDSLRYNDSMFVFGVELLYDSKMLKIKSIPFIGTILGDCENKISTFGNDTIYVSGANTSLNLPPIYGNKPFFAVDGSFLGSCSDSTIVKVNYLETGTEYKGNIKYWDSLIIKPINNSKNGSLTINLDSNSKMNLDENDSTGYVIISNFANEYYTNIHFTVPDSSIINFNKISVLGNNFNLDSNDLEKNTFRLTCSQIDLGIKENILKLEYTVDKKVDIDTVLDFKFKFEQNCNCLNTINVDRFKIKSKARKDTIIKDDIEDYIKINELQKLIYDNSRLEWYLYDILGCNVKDGTEVNLIKDVENINNSQSGIYFLIIKVGDKVLRKKLAIN